jgi:type I restriction enzyme R subunit
MAEHARAHLIENLSISRDDFEIMPVLTREGDWRPADQAFSGKLDEPLRDGDDVGSRRADLRCNRSAA